MIYVMSITSVDYTHSPASTIRLSAAKESIALPPNAKQDLGVGQVSSPVELNPLHWAAIVVGLLLNVLWVGGLAWLAATMLIAFR
jgi:hypothetical protein